MPSDQGKIIIMKIMDNFKVQLFLGMALFSMSVFGEDNDAKFQFSSVINSQIEHRCSVNKDLYLSCLNINEGECRSIFSSIYNICDTDSSELLFDINDQQSIYAFSTCVEEKLQEHLTAKGINLDAACE